MTKDKNFKRVVRSRMADTGEPYTAVRDRLSGEPPEEADRRIVGLEARYSTLPYDSGLERSISPPEVARYLFRRVVSWGRSVNVYLPNGGRLYIVADQVMEYATPECDSARLLLAHAAAGDALFQQFAAEATARLHEQDIRGEISVLHDSGPGGGCHENYSITKGTGVDVLAAVLVPFLVARPLLTGAGAVLRSGGNQRFALSRRAEHVWRRFGEPGSDFGYLTDALAGPAGSFRLHLSCEDANRAEPAGQLKVAATSLVLRVIEERPDLLTGPSIALENPIRALRECSHDITGQRPLRRADRSTVSALELLGIYLTAAKGLLETERATPEERGALAEWERLLGALEARDVGLLASRVDWAAKLRLIQDATDGVESADAALVDASYSQLFPLGLYDELAATEEIDRVCNQSEIEDAGPPRWSAPKATRAHLRSEFIKKATQRRRDYTVDWRHLKLNDEYKRTIVIDDPHSADDARVARLTAAMDDESG